MTEKLTVTNLDIALRMCGIEINNHLLGRIVDVVELVQEKGGETSIEDITKLKRLWT